MSQSRSRAVSRAFWTIAPGEGEIREAPLPSPGPGEVLLEALYSGISRGTESLVFQGHVPPSEYSRMRAPFQGGDFPFPVKYGYQLVARVAEGPEDLMGREVFALHPHQDRAVLPAEAVIPLPDAVPASRAVLAANMETAVNALWDEPPRLGDRIAVVGAGVLGALIAWLAGRIPGTKVTLIDREAGRAPLAARLGVGFALSEDALGAGPDADLVFHTSASSGGLETALAIAADEATVVEMSWHGADPVPVPLGADFHSRRLTLKSSQVGRVAPARRGRISHRDRLAFAISLLDAVPLDALVSSESRFDDLPSVMPELAGGGGQVLCHRIVYPAAESQS